MFIEKMCNELINNFNGRKVNSRRSVEPSEARLMNEPNQPLHIVERPQHATRNNKCVVCSEKNRRAKLANPRATAQDLPKLKKNVYWCTECKFFYVLAVVKIIVLLNITAKVSTGDNKTVYQFIKVTLLETVFCNIIPLLKMNLMIFLMFFY